jgi:hypothetical protein
VKTFKIKNLQLILILFAITFSSCNYIQELKEKIKNKIGLNDEVKISEKVPYSVQIKKLRSYYKAKDIEQRAKKKGVVAYIVSEESEDGNWYRILSGSEQSIDKIEELKKEIQIKLSINNLQIINYQNIKEKLEVNISENIQESKRINSKKPDLPNKIFSLIEKFPRDDNFIVKNFFLVNCPDSVKNIRRYKVGYSLDLDLPRGISLKKLMEKSKCIAEVIYEDNLFGDKVTIDIISLKKNHGIDLDDFQKASFLSSNQKTKQLKIANYFAEKILSTDDYYFEEKVKISISSKFNSLKSILFDDRQNFNGYKVIIKPKKNKEIFRTYFILVSDDLSTLVFSQSTDKSDEEIIEIIQQIGKSNGLNDYDEFYNSFYTLPRTINDEFICFATEKLTAKYAKDRNNAKWSKKMVGHWVTTAHFYAKETKNWSVSLFDLLNDEKVNYIYETLYLKTKRNKSGYKEIDIRERTGLIDLDRYPRELSFPGNRFVVSINNGKDGKLKDFNLINLSKLLQLK